MGFSATPLPAELLIKLPFPDGDADETPAHHVAVSPFALSKTEVTNAQYEMFDPTHAALRGRLGFSKEDDEAVVFVSWHNASNYASWLGKQLSPSRICRLPTEAEWELAARGNGSTKSSYFWTGDTVPTEMQNNQVTRAKLPKPDANGTYAGLPLKVGRFAANGYGLQDTLGNVEEWVRDWHGAYEAAAERNPVGPADGTFKVTRGGSHSTQLYYLRSANRAGALSDDRNWYIGFRVLCDGVSLEDTVVSESPDRLPQVGSGDDTWPTWSDTPMAPVRRKYVRIPGNGSILPFAIHNHEPTIVSCANGDVLAGWYSTNCGEPGRCVGLVQSRLVPGADEWTVAEPTLDAPDRCQCCTAMYFDRPSGVLYHFSAMSPGTDYSDIMGTLRTSNDCGTTWTKPRIIWPDHGVEHQVVVTIIKSSKGEMLMPADHWGDQPFIYKGDQSVIQHAPFDRVFEQSAWHTRPTNGGNYTNTGSHHTSFVELRNGSFAAVGRAHDIDGTMPFAVSNDNAYTWTPHASAFTGIHGGQREVMIRLGDVSQPLLHCTFANGPPSYNATHIPDSSGGSFTVLGVYCAVSEDEGETWGTRRLITTNFSEEGEMVEGFDGKSFKMSYNSSEPNGYMAATVSNEGVIHLITSRNSYSFNLAWLQSLSPPPPGKERAVMI